MSFGGYREDMRGEWLGKPVGLGYTDKDGKFVLYMIQQEEQVIIRIDNQEQTKLFQYIPMATLNDEMVEWLMNESKSRLKTFYGIEEYEVYRNNEFKKIMEETDEIEND